MRIKTRAIRFTQMMTLSSEEYTSKERHKMANNLRRCDAMQCNANYAEAKVIDYRRIKRGCRN